MNDTELEARGSDTAAADAETKRSNGAKRARLLGMIGLAKRAGRLVCGTDAVISAGLVCEKTAARHSRGRYLRKNEEAAFG